MRYHKSVKVIDRLQLIYNYNAPKIVKYFCNYAHSWHYTYLFPYHCSPYKLNILCTKSPISIILIVRKLYQKGEKNLTHNAFLVFTCRDWNRTGSFGDSLDVGGVRGESTSSGRGLVPVGWQVSTDHCTHHSVYICRLQFLNL